MGWNSLRDNPITNFVLGGPAPNQPGVGGAYSGNQNQFVQDPSTGLYFDPTTGNTYTDPMGEFPVTNPNVAQQVAANFARSNAFLNNLASFDAAQKQTLAQQGDLTQHFQDVLSGKRGSLAGMQLQTGLDAIGRQQLAQSAGVSGAGAPLATINAMRNTGSASIAANNAAAQARIAEERDAANALSTLLNQRSLNASRGLDTNIGAGRDFANISMTGATGQQQMDAATAAANAASAEKFGYALVKGLSNASPSGKSKFGNPDEEGGGDDEGGDAGGDLQKGAATYAMFA